MRLWYSYLSYQRATKAQESLLILAKAISTCLHNVLMKVKAKTEH